MFLFEDIASPVKVAPLRIARLPDVTTHRHVLEYALPHCSFKDGEDAVVSWAFTTMYHPFWVNLIKLIYSSTS